MLPNYYITGINLNPSIGEFVYDTLPYRVNGNIVNCFSDGSLKATDLIIAINNLKENYPACKNINIIVSWFCDNLDASQAKVFPSSNCKKTQVYQNSKWSEESWTCSGLTSTSNLFPISGPGTPSDKSVFRLIKYLKSQGFTVSFTPKLIMTDETKSSEITYSADISENASNAINNFVGNATPSMFSYTNDGLLYSGTDFSYSRMILHYAKLCAISGVDLFFIGDGLSGLEAIRGASWTVKGQTDANATIWDYPFVASLNGLCDAVQTILPNTNIAYSVDWKNWMGIYHNDVNAKIPHLDQLYSNPNISYIAIKNYMPLSDWTPSGGIDVDNWNNAPAASKTSYPPSPNVMNNLGLAGFPNLYNQDYLKTNIESGEYFSWYYKDNTSGFLENNYISPSPSSDRASQQRNPYTINQDLLALKRIRWWWNNQHQAMYDAKDGMGVVAHGGYSQWVPNSKPIIFSDYGFKQIDKCTNEPDSYRPYYCNIIINNYPKKDTILFDKALQSVYDYWKKNNEISNDIKMIEQNYCFVSDYDVRSVPSFPLVSSWTIKDYWNWVIKSLK